MQYRNLILIPLTFLLILNVASTPSRDTEPPQDADIRAPPEIDMEIGQNSSHVAWGYTHNGELVNFTASDEVQVFASNTSENSSQPDNETEEDEGDEGTGGSDDSSSHDSDSEADTYRSDSAIEDVENSSTGDNKSENSSNTDNSGPENEKEKKEDDNENLLPTTFPEAGENKGLYQNITGQFTKSSGMLAAVFLAFGGLGAYVYRF